MHLPVTELGPIDGIGVPGIGGIGVPVRYARKDLKWYTKQSTQYLSPTVFHQFRLKGKVSWCRLTTRAPSQYPKRRLFVRSRKVSKPRDWYFKLSYRFEIWQAHRQHCCRSACQISERSDNSKYKSRGFETLRDLTIRRLIEYWNRVQWSMPQIR